MHNGTYAIFFVGGLCCALACRQVRRILPLPALGRPPALPTALEGVLDLAGAAVPVLRLDRLFALPPAPLQAYQHLILLAHAGPDLALLVDRVSDIVRVPADRIAPADADETFNGCVTAHIKTGAASIPLLSAERLLTARERQAIRDFQAAEQYRLDELTSTS